jgi:predicted permease
MLADFRFAVRLLAKQPGFTAIAVLTMAIAIGANTALFSVVNAVVLRPIEYPRPDELVRLWAVNPARAIEFPAVSWIRYVYFRDHATLLANVALSVNNTATLTGSGEAEQVPSLQASANFFPTLGLVPQLGRFFTADEDRTGGPNVALISSRLWQARFANSPNAIGQQILLDGVPHTVVGILPAAMPVPFNQVEIMTPRPDEVTFVTPQQRDGGAAVWQLTARLKPGVTREAAERELIQLNQQIVQQNPQLIDAQNPLQLRFFANEIIPAEVRLASGVLFAAVAAVLLIACANVANLSLARLAGRTKEIAVRASLGAGRWAIVQQFLIESSVVALLGGALGVLLATWSLDGIRLLAHDQLPRIDRVAIDGTTLAFALGVSALAAVLVGIYPAILATRTDVQATLKDTGRGTAGGQANKRFRNLLVVVEVAASVVLLIGAALLLYSFARLQRTALGFDPARVAVGAINLPSEAYPTPEKQREFLRLLEEKLNAAPELSAGGAGFGMPLTGSVALTPYSVAGRPVLPLPERPLVGLSQVGPGFFSSLGMTLREGRFLTSADTASVPSVAVINETLAKKLFPGESAVGHSLLFGRDAEKKCEIVGVVHDVKSAGIAAPAGDQVYFAHAQRGGGFFHVIGKAKPGQKATSVIPVLRRVVHELDPALAVATPQTADELVAQSLQGMRALSALLGAFAALAAVLAAVGIYGVIACNVTQRTAEIGVRIALGASTHDIFRLILRSAGVLVGVGLAIGLAVAAGASRVLQRLLFEVQPLDLGVFALVAVGFAAIGAVAALIPARRATLVDPLVALRSE